MCSVYSLLLTAFGTVPITSDPPLIVRLSGTSNLCVGLSALCVRVASTIWQLLEPANDRATRLVLQHVRHTPFVLSDSTVVRNLVTARNFVAGSFCEV